MSNLVNLDDNTYGIAVESVAYDFERHGKQSIGYTTELGRFTLITDKGFEGKDILGTASLTEITFDCEPYLGVKENGCYTFPTTFLQLLKSKGLMPTEETKILILIKK